MVRVLAAISSAAPAVGSPVPSLCAAVAADSKPRPPWFMINRVGVTSGPELMPPPPPNGGRSRSRSAGGNAGRPRGTAAGVSQVLHSQWIRVPGIPMFPLQYPSM